MRQTMPLAEGLNRRDRTTMKTNTLARQRYEQTLAQCAIRAKLWKEYVATYQKVLQESPETFSAFCAEFRERYLRAAQDR
jgi:predicted component of type VI protein secretion system